MKINIYSKQEKVMELRDVDVSCSLRTTCRNPAQLQGRRKQEVEGEFAAGRMWTPQEQEVKFRLTQSHNQTWQKG